MTNPKKYSIPSTISPDPLLSNSDKKKNIKEISAKVSECHLCDLSKNRIKPVVGEGSLDSLVVFIGEAPGRKENETGRPFVGSAGKLLDRMLSDIGLDRSQVYITNIVKCQPPRNRKPKSLEVRTCTQYLDKQLVIITPLLIAPMGNSAINHVQKRFGLERASVGNIHGRPTTIEAPWGHVIIFPLYHPAAVLYNKSLNPKLMQDFESLRALLDARAQERGVYVAQ